MSWLHDTSMPAWSDAIMRMNRFAACLGVASALLSAVGLVWGAPRAQQNQNVTISVDDARPLMAAVDALEKQFGWVVTYEEGTLVYPGDIVDVTATVRKVQDPTKPRVLYPRGGPLTFVGAYSSGASPAPLLEALLEHYRTAGYPGVFRIVRTGDVFHVVPAKRRNEKGVLEDVQPLLDVPITIADDERSAAWILEAVSEEVRRTNAGSPYLGVATIPMNLFGQARVHLGATNESARTVLVRLLEATSRFLSPPGKLSWRLMCSPSPPGCFLNIHDVRN